MVRFFTLLTALLWQTTFCALGQRPHAALNMRLLGRWQDTLLDPIQDRYNDIWGYAAPNGREYALIGSSFGTNIVDVTMPTAPRLVQRVAGRNPAGWRDFKTYGHYAYAVGDGNYGRGQSLQIFDLRYLPDSVNTVLDSDTICPSAHTCFIEGDRLYLVDTKRMSSPVLFRDVEIYSLANPELPRRLGEVNTRSGRAHAVFVRQDTLYVSGSYGGLYIYDVRQPAAARLLQRIYNYPYNGYNHSSWATPDGRLLVMADEVPQGLPLKLYDTRDLTRSRLLSTFNSHPFATPHNPYLISDRYVVCSSYQDGVQVWDISVPEAPVRAGFFDTYPANDSSFRPIPQNSTGTEPEFGYTGWHGCWGVYPYLPSGNIIASDMEGGLFVISPPYRVPVEPVPPQPPVPGPAVSPIGLWPNPTTGDVTLSLRYPSARLTVEVLDAVGRRVRGALTWEAPAGPVTVPLTGLAPGCYWLRVTRPDDVVRLERVLISQ